MIVAVNAIYWIVFRKRVWRLRKGGQNFVYQTQMTENIRLLCFLFREKSAWYCFMVFVLNTNLPHTVEEQKEHCTLAFVANWRYTYFNTALSKRMATT